jgi:hypothetical protein
MKSGAATTESRQGSKAKRFGFGYEEQSKESPSTQTARAEFLSLTLELRPTVVLDLFNECQADFESFLAKNESKITSLCHRAFSLRRSTLRREHR